jgi:hypothetical protein
MRQISFRICASKWTDEVRTTNEAEFTTSYTLHVPLVGERMEYARYDWIQD